MDADNRSVFMFWFAPAFIGGWIFLPSLSRRGGAQEVLAEFLETAPLRSRLGNGALILDGLPSRARQQAELGSGSVSNPDLLTTEVCRAGATVSSGVFRPLTQRLPRISPPPLPGVHLPKPLKGTRYARRMTIALGILGGGDAVLAADSQETDEGGFKNFALKVSASIPRTSLIGTAPRSVVAVTGCGPGFHLDAIAEEIQKLAQTRPDWTFDSFELELGRYIKGFFNEHVQPLLPHLDYRFNLIVAAQFDGASCLWSSETTIVKRSHQFEALGTGRNYAKAAINTRIISPTIEMAVLLAVRGVMEAKRFDQYCGQNTVIICLHNNAARHIPWYLIEAVEKLFDRYAGTEQSAFQYAIGHFDEDYEKRHLRKLSSWYRKIRSDFKSLSGEIAKEIVKAGQ